jgi:hypothetical protein
LVQSFGFLRVSRLVNQKLSLTLIDLPPHIMLLYGVDRARCNARCSVRKQYSLTYKVNGDTCPVSVVVYAYQATTEGSFVTVHKRCVIFAQGQCHITFEMSLFQTVAWKLVVFKRSVVVECCEWESIVAIYPAHVAGGNPAP